MKLIHSLWQFRPETLRSLEIDQNQNIDINTNWNTFKQGTRTRGHLLLIPTLRSQTMFTHRSKLPTVHFKNIREVPGYDFPRQNLYGRYGFIPGVLHTIFRHGESVWTGFHTNHVSYGDFASSGAERFFAYKFGTRNIDFPREVLILVQIFKIKRHSAGMWRFCDRNLGNDGKHISFVLQIISLLENDV